MRDRSDGGAQAAQIERNADALKSEIRRRSDARLSRMSADLRRLVNGYVLQIAAGHTTPRRALESLMIKAIAYGRVLERETRDDRSGRSWNHLRVVEGQK